MKEHAEVVAALRAIGNPAYGEAIRADRGSQLLYLGVSFPALRARVKQGFSFSSVEVWDELWRTSPYGDVLFAAIEAVRAMNFDTWPLTCEWSSRVDNWCHCDSLSKLYTQALLRDRDNVYDHLVAWNQSENEWLRRLSLTTLLKGHSLAVPIELALPLALNCVGDHRKYVALGLGWLLRDASRAFPAEVRAFLEEHGAAMSAPALRRATSGPLSLRP